MDKCVAKARGAALAGALALGLMVTAAPVSAATFEECQNAIRAADSELDDVVFLSRNHPDKDEAGLRRKLFNASTKLDQVKFGEAIEKLEDARAKVVELRDAPKPKIGDATPDNGNDDVQDILDALDAAIACIDALAMQAAG